MDDPRYAALVAFVREFAADTSIKLVNPEQEPHLAAYISGLALGYQSRAKDVLAALEHEAEQ